jgi:Fuc2NAc and GlcNAc transferase
VKFSDAVALLAICLAAVVAGTAGFLRLAPRLGLLDHPNVRSAHSRVTPRGGGVILLFAVGMAVAVGARGAGFGRGAAALAAATVAIALAGLADDRWRLPAWPRMAVHVLAGVAVAAAAGGIARLPLPAPLDLALGVAAPLLAVVWLVSVVNFYNFLDGIDGLAAFQGVVTGLGIALAGWHPLATAAGVALCGACIGFLVFNWSPARVFLGDVGSGLLGASFGVLPFLAAPSDRPRAVFFVALSLWLFLADAVWTLARRAARGERLHEPHREHVYQRLVATGLGHAPVAAGLGAGSVLLTGLALLAWRRGGGWDWAALAAAVSLFAVELLLLARRSGGRAVGAPAVQEAHVG